MVCYHPLVFHCQDCDKEHNTYDPTEVLLLSEAESLEDVSQVFDEAEELARKSQQEKLSVLVEGSIIPTLFGMWVGELSFN